MLDTQVLFMGGIGVADGRRTGTISLAVGDIEPTHHDIACFVIGDAIKAVYRPNSERNNHAHEYADHAVRRSG